MRCLQGLSQASPSWLALHAERAQALLDGVIIVQRLPGAAEEVVTFGRQCEGEIDFKTLTQQTHLTRGEVTFSRAMVWRASASKTIC